MKNNEHNSKGCVKWKHIFYMVLTITGISVWRVVWKSGNGSIIINDFHSGIIIGTMLTIITILSILLIGMIEGWFD